MIRKLFLHLLPFLLPFIAFLIYAVVTRRAQRKGSMWADTPYFWLTSSGLMLVIAGLVTAAVIGGDPPGGTYFPATVVDGEVVPGRVE